MFRMITYTLAASMTIATAASADVAATPGQEAVVAPEEKLVCKRYVETGSLAKMVKECHTAANWQRMAIAGRDDARSMVLKGINSFGRRD